MQELPIFMPANEEGPSPELGRRWVEDASAGKGYQSSEGEANIEDFSSALSDVRWALGKWF